MSYFVTIPKSNSRPLGTKSPKTAREKKFIELWQQKKYEEAFNYFPNEWKFFGEDIENEIYRDMILSVSSGIFFSEKAFNLMSQFFPVELKLHHHIKIDERPLVWISSPVFSHEDLNNLSLGMFYLKPSYRLFFSSYFVDTWKKNDLVSLPIAEINCDPFQFKGFPLSEF